MKKLKAVHIKLNQTKIKFEFIFKHVRYTHYLVLLRMTPTNDMPIYREIDVDFVLEKLKNAQDQDHTSTQESQVQ